MQHDKFQIISPNRNKKMSGNPYRNDKNKVLPVSPVRSYLMLREKILVIKVGFSWGGGVFYVNNRVF